VSHSPTARLRGGATAERIGMIRAVSCEEPDMIEGQDSMMIHRSSQARQV
jgi:hypothetical protein